MQENEYQLAVERLKLTTKLRHISEGIGYKIDDQAIIAIDKKKAEYALRSFDAFYFDERITKYISLQNLWMLGVDGQDHQHGRLSYDNGTNTFKCFEPGYIDAMETALAFMFRTIEHELSPTYIRRLHCLCCCDVKRIDSSSCSEHILPDGSPIRTGGRCPLNSTYVTEDGLEEITSYSFLKVFCMYIDETLSPGTVNVYWKLFNSKIFCRLGEMGVKQDEDAEKLLASFVHDYLQKSNNPKSNTDDIILAIAEFSQKMEFSHFFPDGNLRTIRVILLKLLIQHQLPLACIYDPNILDGHSKKQISNATKDGIEIYKKIEPQLSSNLNSYKR